jgi:hypothetical protein
MIGKLLAVSAAASIMVFGLIGKAVDFLQVYGNNPPAQGATWPDLGPYFNLVAIIVGVLGIAFSIYFIYRDRWAMSAKIEKSVDSAIIIKNICRCPLNYGSWEGFKQSIENKYISSLIIALSPVLTFIIYFLSSGIYYYYKLLTLSDIGFTGYELLLLIIYAIGSFGFFIAYRRSRASYLNLGNKPEECIRLVMDNAEMSIYANYNYLLAKAYWSLKQMEASGITIGDDYAEGFLRIDPHLCSLKASIMPKQNGTGIFTILIECTRAKENPVIINEFIRGKYINRFLDLMGSGGFGPKNHD